MDVNSAVLSLKETITFFLMLYENLSFLVNFKVLESSNLEENMGTF